MQYLSALKHGRWEGLKPVQPAQVVTDLSSFNIDKIVINPTLNFNNETTWLFTDNENPVVYIDSQFLGHEIAINGQYYDEHKEEMDNVIYYICSNVKAERFTLTKDLISKKNIVALVSNPNIKGIKLGDYGEDYELTVEDYELIKDYHIERVDTKNVVPELRDIFGGKITCNDERPLFQGRRYKDLVKDRDLRIEAPVSEEEIESLKYLNDGINIIFGEYSDFENMFRVIDRLEELNKGCKYTIIVQSKGNFDHKNDFNNFIFQHPDYLGNDRITMGVGIMEEYPLVDYVKYEKRLIELIKPALNLSPYEKYLYAYNVAKKYKQYKENNENKGKSRNLYNILDGEFMVCVGYATLLGDLLTKLGIESAPLSVSIDIGYDKVPDDAMVIPDDVAVQSAGHARLRVHLVDPKYNIDGIYFADPTWDNVMDADSYNYSLLTADEYNGMNRYNFLNFYDVDELFFVHSLEEFYQKANVWMDKNEKRIRKEKEDSLVKRNKDFQDKAIKFVDELERFNKVEADEIRMLFGNVFRSTIPASNMNTFIYRAESVVNNYNEPSLKKMFSDMKYSSDTVGYAKKDLTNMNNSVTLSFMKNIVNTIASIDKEMAAKFNEKYPEIQSYGFTPGKDYIESFMLEAGEYIVSKSNNMVPGATMREAITEVYRKTTDTPEEDLEKTIDDVMSFNRRRHRLAFPVRYKEAADGVRVPVMNDYNKFDVDENEVSLS